MLAHYILYRMTYMHEHKFVDIADIANINIADIYSEIKPRRFSGFGYQYPKYPYYWFNIYKINSTRYEFTTCYDRRKWPIITIGLDSL
jgi:hypothetical protein